VNDESSWPGVAWRGPAIHVFISRTKKVSRTKKQDVDHRDKRGDDGFDSNTGLDCSAKADLPRLLTSDNSVAHQRPGGFDFPPQPTRPDIVAVGPGRRTVFEKDARKIAGIAQWFGHWTTILYDRGKFVISTCPVVENYVKTKSAK
jgi:hypothetical protein